MFGFGKKKKAKEEKARKLAEQQAAEAKAAEEKKKAEEEKKAKEEAAKAQEEKKAQEKAEKVEVKEETEETVASAEDNEEINEDSEEAKKEAARVYHIARRAAENERGYIWIIRFGGSDKVIKSFATQAEAIAFTKELAKKYDRRYVIHKASGGFRKMKY